jgi:hypothetical protein
MGLVHLGVGLELLGLPPALPTGLNVAFATDPAKQTQWEAFGRRRPEQKLPDLPEMVAEISRLVELPLLAIGDRQPSARKWNFVRMA